MTHGTTLLMPPDPIRLGGFNLDTPTDLSQGFGSGNRYGTCRFNNDGSKFYVVNNGVVLEYPLSTEYDLSSRGTSTSLIIGSLSDDAIEFSSDGGWLYYSDLPNTVRAFFLTTPWDIDTALANPDVKLELSSIGSFRIFVGANDTKLYVLDMVNGVIRQFTMSTPGDVRTATLDGTFTLSSSGGTNDHEDFYITKNGTKLYTILTNGVMRSYPLSTRWDVTTAGSATLEGGVFDGGTNIDFVHGWTFGEVPEGDLCVLTHRNLSGDAIQTWDTSA